MVIIGAITVGMLRGLNAPSNIGTANKEAFSRAVLLDQVEAVEVAVGGASRWWSALKSGIDLQIIFLFNTRK